MAKKDARLGSKVRAHRRRRGLTQVELARRLGISASYLNLIEHNQRPLTAPLLIKLAQQFQLDFADFSADTDARLTTDLIEAFSDPIFEDHALTAADMSEFAQANPGVAQAVLSLYHHFNTARDQAAGLADVIYAGQDDQDVTKARLPSEEVNDFVQDRMNYFAELEEAAARLIADTDLTMGARQRGMAEYLERHGVKVKIGGEPGSTLLRHYDRDAGVVTLSDALPPSSRNFQLAVQIGLLTQSEYMDEVVESSGLPTEASKKLCRLVMANYFAGAVLLPYDQFLAAARDERYDIELLIHRFGVSFEQICHRLTTLRAPGKEGVPFHMLRVDVAGNISKRFSASGIRFARFSGACPRWNVFSSFHTPGRIRIQISMMPDGERFFCVARTVPKGRGGFRAAHTLHAVGLGCQVEHARELIYADGVDVESSESDVPVGVTCRLCERKDCEQRAFPSLRHPLRVDEDVRTASLFMPVDE